MERDQAKENKDQFVRENIFPVLRDILGALIVVIIFFVLVFRVSVVSGPSMMDTLQDGDYLILLNNLFYTQPQYGDIVVVSKQSFDGGKAIIKRVIATEGQKVDIDFEAGIVYVDDKPLTEPYTLTPTNLQEGTQFPLVVEKGCVFVMGDNRNRSKDSRDPEIGLVDERQILGKAIFLFFPGVSDTTQTREFDRIGVIP